MTSLSYSSFFAAGPSPPSRRRMTACMRAMSSFTSKGFVT